MPTSWSERPPLLLPSERACSPRCSGLIPSKRPLGQFRWARSCEFFRPDQPDFVNAATLCHFVRAWVSSDVHARRRERPSTQLFSSLSCSTLETHPSPVLPGIPSGRRTRLRPSSELLPPGTLVAISRTPISGPEGRKRNCSRPLPPPTTPDVRCPRTLSGSFLGARDPHLHCLSLFTTAL